MSTGVTEQIDTNVCLPWTAPVEVDGMDIAEEAERDATRVLRATHSRGYRIERETWVRDPHWHR